MKKTKYKALTLGTELYCWAWSEKQAKNLLQRKAQSKFGRYCFTDFFKLDGQEWKRISYGF